MVNQVTLAQLLSEAMAIYVTQNQLLNRISSWATLVTNLGIAGLQAAPYSMTSGDATDLFNAANDWLKFRKTALGLGYVTFGATAGTGTPTDNDGTHFGYNFFVNPSKVAGLGY